MNIEKIEDLGIKLMEEIYGKEFIDIIKEKEDLGNTPKRFAKAIREWFTPEDVKFTTFPAEGFGEVEVGEINFHSFCEHHLAAIIGKVKIIYTPNEKVAGLSKFPRAVKHFAAKPMIQEQFNKDIFEFLWEKLNPKKLYVEVEALHTCMTTRGAKSVNATTVTRMKRKA